MISNLRQDLGVQPISSAQIGNAGMPLYQFEITDGDATKTMAIECRDLDEVRVQALQLANRSIAELGVDFWKKARWALRVTDDTNMTIVALTFSGD
jgi:hypothetical protein